MNRIKTVSLLFPIPMLCQFPFHQRMVEDKQQRLWEISRLMDELAPHDSADLTHDRLEKLQYLQALTRDTTQLPEWPFGWKIFGGVVAGALAAVSPTIATTVAAELLTMIM